MDAQIVAPAREPALTLEGEPVAYIAFDDNVPVAVLTGEWVRLLPEAENTDMYASCSATAPGAVLLPGTVWYFEYSRAVGQFCAHAHAFGRFPINALDIEYRYWATPGAAYDETIEAASGRRLRALPSRYSVPALLENAWITDTVYCSKCDDWLPTEYAERYCPHVAWCYECGEWNTPSKPCSCGNPPGNGEVRE